MPQIPRDPRPDATLAVLREGYHYIPHGRERFHSPVFRTRLLLQDTLCLSGAGAAELFYDESRFQRAGALPRRLHKTLFGEGGVQGLDGEAHRCRKAMWMSLMTPPRLQELVALTERVWRSELRRWQEQPRLVLLEELQRVICRAVCHWAGVPLPEEDVDRRTRHMVRMVEGAGAVGPRHWRGRRAHQAAEAWMADLLEAVRAGELTVPEEAGLHVMAFHRDPDGERLPAPVAAVDMLSLLRPTVAVAWFITFAALALHEHPQWRARLAADDALLEPFVQEVRRLYAFFPFVAARVRRDFDWRGFHFPAGTRVLLDLYGTNRDPEVWEDPQAFRPERFRRWDGSAYNFITQGGGNHYRNHRCAGEWATIELMKAGVRLLTRAMRYRVPEQDLSLDPARVPAQPASGLVIEAVTALQ